MEYIKTNWNDDTEPSISAENLNNIENGIEDAKNKINDLKAEILYSDEIGTYTTATLNDNISNYSKIVIIWEPNVYAEFLGRRTTTDYDFKPNKLYIFNTIFYNFDNKQIYTTLTGYQINDNILTISLNQAGTVGASNSYTAAANVMKVVKVIGYK